MMARINSSTNATPTATTYTEVPPILAPTTEAAPASTATPTLTACQVMDARAAELDAREVALRIKSAKLDTRSAILDDKLAKLMHVEDVDYPVRVYTPVADAFKKHAIRMGKTIFDCREAMGQIAKDAGFTEQEVLEVAGLELQMNFPNYNMEDTIKKLNTWDMPGGSMFHSCSDFPEETYTERREDFIINQVMNWMDIGFMLDHIVEDRQKAQNELDDKEVNAIFHVQKVDNTQLAEDEEDKAQLAEDEEDKAQLAENMTDEELQAVGQKRVRE